MPTTGRGKGLIRTGRVMKWSQRKWKLTQGERNDNGGGGATFDLAKKLEGKPGKESAERLRLDRGWRESLILGLTSSLVWEEHQGQEAWQVG